MLDDDQIPIEVSPGCIDCFCIWSCKDDRSFSSRVDRCPARVGEFDSVMGFARPAGCGAISIGWINQVVRRRLDRAPEDEVALVYTIVNEEGIAGRRRRKCWW